ncbi:MAG: imidazoleglycerol-phosphate dehydratase HisB [bacterium]|nr:imidazoleglycerol-phosphate dehydratase HisB [bacterium]
MTRSAAFERTTKETSIKGRLTLEGSGLGEIKTGLGFLDHMLDLFKFHGGFDLELVCEGDLWIDAHHSVEDIALALGSALNEALGERKGIKRYATYYLPMDECLTRTSLDISGRAYHVFKGFLSTPLVGEFPTEMTAHFFQSFAQAARLTLHQEILYGENDHHRIESLFKGFARALAEAATFVGGGVPSSKGVL